VRRLLVLAAVGAAVAAAGAPTASATNECRGLLICVPVHGPWVVVPAGLGTPRARVEYQMTCPRGFIVAGLDAELSHRPIDISFLGTLGSPVNPGVSTARAVVFVATYVGGSAQAPSFRPHIGCMPAQGGGGRIPTSVSAYPPGRPTMRRAKDVRVRAATNRRLVQACAADERLVAGWHAVGFYMRTPPGGALVSSVATSEALRGGRVAVSVRAGAGVRGTRTIVQVGAVCTGGAA
jgi:hypothetical protein